MVRIDIPDFGTLELHHLVLDFNGTLAVDGVLIPGVGERLRSLAERVKVHVITADTFGRVAAEMEGLPCEVHILPPGAQDEAKRAFVADLGADGTVAMGNGRNDRLMLAEAALGVAVIHAEGAAAVTLAAADVVTPTINDALDLLVKPLRLVASLRS